MTWLYQYKIASCVVQIDSDTDACHKDMQKFLCLYERVEHAKADIIFSVRKVDMGYAFVFSLPSGYEEVLWQSKDAREISAALETHLYTRLIQLLDSKDMISIHSSVLNINDVAIMFAGVSGAGKSSICTAALLDKAAYLSDEFTLLDAQGLVHPFPRPMQWEHPEHPAFERQDILDTGLIDAAIFDFPAATGDMARCHLWYPKQVQRKALPLRYIVLHQYRSDIKETKLFEIPRHEALASLPEHLHIQHGLAKDLPKLNQRIPQACQYYRLYFPDVKQAWKVMKEEVLQSA